MLRLGVVSDLHGNLENAKRASKELEGKIDVLLITGDLTGNFSPFISGRAVLRAFKNIKVPKFVMSGSHEPVNVYEDIMAGFLDFHDCIREPNRVKSLNGYDLLFLPGSDWNSELGEFRIYKNKEKLEKEKEKLPDLNWRFFFIEELQKYLKNPEKTILISHIPPKFEGKEAIDRAEFTEAVFEGKDNEGYEPGSEELEEIDEEVEMKVREENVGNRALKEFIRKQGIKKLICGHIHEAGGRAQGLDGSLIDEEKYSEEFFYNVGALEKGLAGVVTLKGNKAKYSKIQV